MNKLDYELGFSSADGDWNNADGMLAAKAALVACNTKCNISHPFNRGKRDDCKGKCEAAYSAKTEYITDVIQAPSSQSKTPTLDSSRAKDEYTSIPCPSGMNHYGDGSACVDSSGNKCANVGNPTLERCSTASSGSGTMSESSDSKGGMSTGLKIGIGVGALALIVVAVIIIKKRKS